MKLALGLVGTLLVLASDGAASPLKERGWCPCANAQDGAKILKDTGLVQFCSAILSCLVPTTTSTSVVSASTTTFTRTSTFVSTITSTPTSTSTFVVSTTTTQTVSSGTYTSSVTVSGITTAPTLATTTSTSTVTVNPTQTTTFSTSTLVAISYTSVACPSVGTPAAYPTSGGSRRSLEDLEERGWPWPVGGLLCAKNLPSGWLLCAQDLVRDSCEIALYGKTYATSVVVKTSTQPVASTTVTATQTVSSTVQASTTVVVSTTSTSTFTATQTIPATSVTQTSTVYTATVPSGTTTVVQSVTVTGSTVLVATTTTSTIPVCSAYTFTNPIVATGAAAANPPTTAGCFQLVPISGITANVQCAVTAAGAVGGSSVYQSQYNNAGGSGANVLSPLSLSFSATYQYAIGVSGVSIDYQYSESGVAQGGGAGATWLLDVSSGTTYPGTPMVIAGGGGGAGMLTAGEPAPLLITTQYSAANSQGGGLAPFQQMEMVCSAGGGAGLSSNGENGRASVPGTGGPCGTGGSAPRNYTGGVSNVANLDYGPDGTAAGGFGGGGEGLQGGGGGGAGLSGGTAGAYIGITNGVLDRGTGGNGGTSFVNGAYFLYQPAPSQYYATAYNTPGGGLLTFGPPTQVV